MCPKFLTKEEIEEKIKDFLADHNYQYSEKVVVQKRLKAIDYEVTTADSKIAIMLFIWNRSLPYDKVYYLEEYLNKYEIDKVILICKQISPRAKEIIRKEKISIDIIFESDFRTMKSSPLLGKL
ncbi:MAG: hypothetical protein KGD59_01150 [Candidatus Heimdallarchaeota archaeon]|nr:hypothetical protein [Candidatus Heimdallarchaeota archaeon]MBY8993126.1 hypothetical protein [Candidatus Heimdallarchaeota archaeon]